jgi:hypothetical protein
MPRYNNSPVQPEKIQLIYDLLNDPIVKDAWRRFVMLGQPQHGSNGTIYKEREKAFTEYATARDKFLGLPPLIVPSVQGTHNRYRF